MSEQDDIRQEISEALEFLCTRFGLNLYDGADESSQRLAETELGDFVYTLSRKPRPDPTIEALTEREREIAEAVGRGLQNKEIAAELNISRHTVSSHLRRIFRKLRVHSRAAVGTYMAEMVA